MQYRKFGRTGLNVSRLCLGTMTFGLQTEEDVSRSIMDRAADAGVICPIPGAPLAVALAVAGNPRYGKLDAQSAAEHARQALPEVLGLAHVELPPTAPLGTQVAFMARLAGLTPHAAADACSKLNGRGVPCMTISPARG